METKEIVELAAQAAWPVLALAIPWLTKKALDHFKEKDQEKLFQTAVDSAYLIVHQISRKTENKIDDKLAEALKAMKEVLGRELTHTEAIKAKAMLRAKHEGIKFPNLLGVFGNVLGNKD